MSMTNENWTKMNEAWKLANEAVEMLGGIDPHSCGDHVRAVLSVHDELKETVAKLDVLIGHTA